MIANLVVPETATIEKRAHLWSVGEGKVRRWSAVCEKASAYFRLVSAPLTSRALAIAVAPWSPILLAYKL